MDEKTLAQLETEKALKFYRREKKNALRRKVRLQLLLAKAEKAGITVSEAEVDAALKS